MHKAWAFSHANISKNHGSGGWIPLASVFLLYSSGQTEMNIEQLDAVGAIVKIESGWPTDSLPLVMRPIFVNM